MAADDGHIIDKLRIELSVQSPDQAHEIQNRVSSIVQQELRSMLDELFRDVSGERHFVLDKLELDLGLMSLISLEEELVSEVRSKIRNKLTEIISRVRFSKDEKVSTSEDTEKLFESEDELYLAVLVRYLQTGTYPWYVSSEMSKDQLRDPEDLFRRLLESDYNRLKKKITDGLSDEYFRRRIAGQFSDNSIQEILALFTGSSQSVFKDVMGVTKTLRSKNIPSFPPVTIKEFLLEGLHRYQKSGKLGEVDLAGSLTEQLKIKHLHYFVTKEDPRTSATGEGTLLTSKEWIEELHILTAGTELQEFVEDLLDQFTTVEEDQVLADPALISKLEKELEKQLRFDVPGETSKGFKTPSEQTAKEDIGEDDDVWEGNEIEENYVSNAGLVLLWPYLVRFFRKLELTVDREFIDRNAQIKAVHLLQYLVTESEDTFEHLMVLNKILCGYQLEYPLPSDVNFSETEKEEAETVVQSAIDHWDALKNTSVEGFREAFLNRNGRLRQEEQQWTLHVESKGFDVLLERLPWSLSVVKFPWMSKPLHVEWR